jgi:phage gpG-like protein
MRRSASNSERKKPATAGREEDVADPDALLTQFKGLELRTMRTSPFIAAEMGRAFHDRLVNVTLRRYEHPMYERTNSPAGQPPAFMSGELAYSVTTEVKGGASTSRAWVGPHTIYAAVQEFGAVINVKHSTTTKTGKTVPGFMRWYMDGSFWYKRQVTIPERSYMRRTRDEMIADGSLHRTAVEAFLSGMNF